ncbi:hypothetical protein SprV_0501822400 [Sparganum proliferum]
MTSLGIKRPGGKQERQAQGSTKPTASSSSKLNAYPWVTPPDVPPSTSNSPPTPTINNGRTPKSSLRSSFIASTSVTTAPAASPTALNPDLPANINLTNATTSDMDSVHTCPPRDHTFTSRIGLVGHLRFHLTETAKPVPETPTYTQRSRLKLPSLHPHIYSPHVPIRPHARSRKPAADNLHHTITSSLTYITHHHPPPASNFTFHAGVKCASRLRPHMASMLHV